MFVLKLYGIQILLKIYTIFNNSSIDLIHCKAYYP